MVSRASPFPGMDPYLESKWPEVHARLIVYAANQLNAQLPEDLQTSIERTAAVSGEDDRRSIRPDLMVVKEPAAVQQAARARGMIAKPYLVPRDEFPERHLRITDAEGRVITVIEFLSPWNKIGQLARERYTRKQAVYLDAGINLVEIDLVRQGVYVLAAAESALPEEARGGPLICVYRPTHPDRFEIYPAALRQRLPDIPVPLRPSEADAVLQLQALIDDCYRDGRYWRIDYQQDPVPRLDPDDTQWLDGLLRSQGRRV